MTLRMSAVAGTLVVLALAILIGFALSVALLGTTERYGGAVGGEWWIPLFTATSVGLGWIGARVLPPVAALAVSALAPPLAILTLMAVKVIRWPMWPAAGDGFGVLLLVCAGLGVVAMIVARAADRALLPPAMRAFVTFGLLSLTSIGAATALVMLAGLVGS